MAWPHSIMQVLTDGSERSNGLIPPLWLPSTAKWCLQPPSSSARDALQSQLRLILGLVFALQVLLSPSQHYIVYILQAQDSSTEVQHTHTKLLNTHLVPLGMTLTSFCFFFFPKKKKHKKKPKQKKTQTKKTQPNNQPKKKKPTTLNGHRNILIGGNIYNMKLLDWFLVLFFSVIL